MTRLNVRRYCRCGGTLNGYSQPPDLAADLTAEFDRIHQGEDHGPATPAQASRARRKAELGDTP